MFLRTFPSLLGSLVSVMGTRQDSPEKIIRWINELESLDVTAKVQNELNDLQEISSICKYFTTHTNNSNTIYNR
ncbi:hypothetical protein BH18THE2_BH18THE2_37120 [soil metagenome]